MSNIRSHVLYLLETLPFSKIVFFDDYRLEKVMVTLVYQYFHQTLKKEKIQIIVHGLN